MRYGQFVHTGHGANIKFDSVGSKIISKMSFRTFHNVFYINFGLVEFQNLVLDILNTFGPQEAAKYPHFDRSAIYDPLCAFYFKLSESPKFSSEWFLRLKTYNSNLFS